MCLAIPGKIESMTGENAVVNIEGNRINAMTALVPEAEVGDWVLVHAGLAVTVMSDEEANETLSLIREKYEAVDE
jgi:hydrogenase expression/formation protein HypC